MSKWMKIPGTLTLQSYIAPVDFNIDDETVKQGSWIMKLEVHDDEVWEDLVNEIKKSRPKREPRQSRP